MPPLRVLRGLLALLPWLDSCASIALGNEVRVVGLHRHAAVGMLAKSKSRKPAKKAGPTKISTRGFGSAAPKPGTKLLDEPVYKDLYEWLNTSPLTNLRKVGVAEFDGLRGVMALQDIAAGEEIVAIPATFAVDLGTESADPLPAAQRLLTVRSSELNVEPQSERAVYWASLPPPDSADLCTPDFFSEKELMMVQWPPIITEARKRSAQIRAALGAAAPSGDTQRDQLSAAGGGMRELRWAVWLVLSRVLTVVAPNDGKQSFPSGGPIGHKLLIPFIDMCAAGAAARKAEHELQAATLASHAVSLVPTSWLSTPCHVCRMLKVQPQGRDETLSHRPHRWHAASRRRVECEGG